MRKEHLDRLLEEIKKEPKRNRRVEHLQVLRFLSVYSGIPEGVPRFDEKPDLLIQTNLGILGVEHTRILDNSTKGQEELQREILERAQVMYEQQGGSMLHVDAIFDVHTQLTSKDKIRIAQQLADAIKDFDLKLGTGREQDRWWNIETWHFNFHGRGKFPNEISNVGIKYVERPGLVLWATSGGVTTSHLTSERIQEEVDGKNKKLSAYRERCQNVWILIVANRGTSSSDFKLPPNIDAHLFQSDFNRVFCFESFSENIVELRVSPSEANQD